MLVSFFFLSGEFLLHIPCCLDFYAGFYFYAGNFSYTSRAVLIFPQGVSLTHPMIDDFFLLIFFLNQGSFSYNSYAGFIFWGGGGCFSYTSRAGFIFSWGVSLTHPMLSCFFCRDFSYTSRAGFFFFLTGEFLLHIPCCFVFVLFLFFSGFFLLFSSFYRGSFSYTSRAGFIFIWGVSLTHPMLASFLSGEFLLHIPCWLHFYLGCFSYTSHASFFFYLGSFSYTLCAGFTFIWAFFSSFF